MTNHATGIGTWYSKWHDNSELPFLGDASGKNPDHTEFQSWIVNFRTEVRTKAKNPMLALQCIKEIEAANSLDDLITPKSITGNIFTDYEELDLMMAAALKRCYDKQTHFRKKISVEEQRAQKDNQISQKGDRIAYLIYEYFRPTGSCDEIQGLSGLFSIKMEDDDIQDFDLRWEQALLLTNDPPSDKVLEGLYACKLQESSQAHTIVALFNQEILRGGGERDYHRLRMCVRSHIEQSIEQEFQDSKRSYRAWSRDQRKVTKSFYQTEDKRMLSVESNWVLL